MTITDHNELYQELRKVIYSKGLNTKGLTVAQLVFVQAMEMAVFGGDMLKMYSELVDDHPNIDIKTLHAFCIGWGLGIRNKGFTIKEDNQKSH
jgi:hypothetical protein